MTSWHSMKDLLEAEGRALRAGRLGDIDQIHARKEALLPKLAEPASEELKRAVGTLAERNAGLLDAAGRGVKAALHRVSEAQRIEQLRTYDDAGTAHALGASRSLVERKA